MIELNGLTKVFGMRWGPWGALWYFTGTVAVVFIAAVIVINRRDA